METTTAPAPSPATGRDERGRFTKGNPGGPGNPAVRRLAEFQAAIHEVVTPQRFRLILATLLKAAVDEQDVPAARLIFDRVLGKSRAEPVPDLDLGLPNGLESAEDIAKISNALLKAVLCGALAPEDAARTAAVIEAARKSLETQDLARRIAELEAQAEREKDRRR